MIGLLPTDQTVVWTQLLPDAKIFGTPALETKEPIDLPLGQKVEYVPSYKPGMQFEKR